MIRGYYDPYEGAVSLSGGHPKLSFMLSFSRLRLPSRKCLVLETTTTIS